MATIIPIGSQTVGNATVTLLSFFTSNEFGDTNYPPPVHKVYIQADPANTVQVDIKYNGKIVSTLWKPPTTGSLPEHFMTGDENVGNTIDISRITLTSTSSGSKIQGYITMT